MLSDEDSSDSDAEFEDDADDDNNLDDEGDDELDVVEQSVSFSYRKLNEAHCVSCFRMKVCHLAKL